MRFTITRAVSGLSGDASQLASAARRPAELAGISTLPLFEHREHTGLDLSQLVLHIADLQDVGGGRGLVAVRDGVGRGRRIGLRQLDLMQLLAQRGALLALFRRQRVHHFVPQRLDLLFGVLGQCLLLGRALVFGNVKRLAQLRLELRQLLLAQHAARYGFSISAICFLTGLRRAS